MDLLVNKRYKHSHALPKVVKLAMGQVQSEAMHEAATARFSPEKNDTYVVTITFYFTSMRGDIDGPIKRTVDAFFAGIRDYLDEAYINDGRIVDLAVSKRVADVPKVVVGIACTSLIEVIESKNAGEATLPGGSGTLKTHE